MQAHLLPLLLLQDCQALLESHGLCLLVQAQITGSVKSKPRAVPEPHEPPVGPEVPQGSPSESAPQTSSPVSMETVLTGGLTSG